MKNMTPPKWALNAVATEQGWVNPRTGEILVSIRGLKSKIEAMQQPPSVVVLDIKSPEECNVETTQFEITTTPALENSIINQEVSEKKGRGRPKKIQN